MRALSRFSARRRFASPDRPAAPPVDNEASDGALRARRVITPVLTREGLPESAWSIGAHTYGVPRVHRWGDTARLGIGRYTSIADGVQLFLGGNHRTDWATTYPFGSLSFFPEAAGIAGHPATNGDLRIGNDVSIGAGATIHAGVTIGDGAVIGNGSVVASDVAPYEIVAGHPARVVQRRFDRPMADRLLQLRWWDWDDYKVRQAIPLLQSSDLEALFAFAARAQAPGLYVVPKRRRVWDCALYNGEADVLAVRLQELAPVVDQFVLIEGDRTFSGAPRTPRYDPSDARLRPFADRIRHVTVEDFPDTDDPWVRERHQRNAMRAAVADAAPSDLVLMCDVDEVPRAWAVAFMAGLPDSEIFGLELRLSYFYFNYCAIKGPDATMISAVAATKAHIDRIEPQELRMGIRQGRVAAMVLPRSGWHFSYLFDLDGVRRKIAEFSHQEFNTPEFLAGLDLERLVRSRSDLFGERGNVWDVVGADDVPAAILADPGRYGRWLL